MRYRIAKGEHSTFRFPKIYSGKAIALEGNFNFFSSCWYERPDDHIDWLDLNKLVGISFGFHQQDSLRIGWRPLFDKFNHIEVFAYWYNEGQMTFELIGHVEVDSAYAFQVMLVRQQQEVIFQLEGLSPKKIPFTFPPTTWGYFLYPYFGGNFTAPQDMEMEVRMEIKKEG